MKILMSIIQSVVRYVITLFMGFLVGKGIIDSSQGAGFAPTLIDFFVLILTGGGAIGWSFLEKKLKGWVK